MARRRPQAAPFTCSPPAHSRCTATSGGPSAPSAFWKPRAQAGSMAIACSSGTSGAMTSAAASRFAATLWTISPASQPSAAMAQALSNGSIPASTGWPDISGGKAGVLMARPSCHALRHQRAGHVAEGLRLGRVGFGDHDRRTAIRGGADVDMQRYFGHQGNAHLLALRLDPAMAEDMFLMAALAADMGGHVLDHAEHRHLELVEHVDPLARIQQRDILRGRDDDRPVHHRLLRQRHRYVAGAGRQID